MTYCKIILLILFFSSCGNRVEKDIAQIRSRKIEIPLEEMTCWKNDTLQNLDIVEITAKPSFKYIIYIDSSLCSTCNIEQLYHWNAFISKYDSIQFYFILAPKNRQDAQVLPLYFKKSQLNHSIFIDEQYAFLRYNSHIPNRQMYHYMLLDRDNNAVLIGNPLFNRKIESMLSDLLGNN